MSLDHGASDPVLAGYLADWDKRMAAAKKARPADRYTRKALTKETPAYAYLFSSVDEEMVSMPLSEIEKLCLHFALNGGANPYRIGEVTGRNIYTLRKALVRLKAKLRGRGIQFDDNRHANNPDGRLLVLEKDKGEALLNEGIAP